MLPPRYIAVAASQTWKRPSNITFAHAASLAIVGTIALLMAIEQIGRIDSKTMILVNCAMGGFGMIVLKLLKQKGGQVTTLTSSYKIEEDRDWPTLRNHLMLISYFC